MKLADKITYFRIISVPFLWILIFTNKTIFLILFILAGLSDVVDGIVARKQKNHSKKGGNFDAEADIVLLTSVFIWTIIFFQNIIQQYLNYILVPITLFTIAIMISTIKHKKIIILHTYLAKTSGLAIYLLFITLLLNVINPIITYTVITITSLASLELIAIYLTKKKINQEKTKSIF